MKSGRRIAHYGQRQDNRQTTRDKPGALRPRRAVTAAGDICKAQRKAWMPASGRHYGEGRLAAAFVDYFSLISRRRSSRKPWAVIGSGYRLGLSGVMHDGSTSIRKSGFGCRKNGTE